MKAMTPAQSRIVAMWNLERPKSLREISVCVSFHGDGGALGIRGDSPLVLDMDRPELSGKTIKSILILA